MKIEVDSEEINGLYKRSMEIIDTMWVVYRDDNPSARLVLDTESKAKTCQKLLIEKFKSHFVNFSCITLHDYFNTLRRLDTSTIFLKKVEDILEI